jgi:hypothetical protein
MSNKQPQHAPCTTQQHTTTLITNADERDMIKMIQERHDRQQQAERNAQLCREAAQTAPPPSKAVRPEPYEWNESEVSLASNDNELDRLLHAMNAGMGNYAVTPTAVAVTTQPPNAPNVQRPQVVIPTQPPNAERYGQQVFKAPYNIHAGAQRMIYYRALLDY